MKFVYTNYKNETEERDVDVKSIQFLAHPGFGYEPGVFLTGIDRARNAERSFRLDHRFKPLASDVSGNGNATYEITEGHQVRTAVQALADAVTSEAPYPVKRP